MLIVLSNLLHINCNLHELFDVQEGQGLIDDSHYATPDIRKRLEELELSWQALIAASTEKKDRLQDAYRVWMQQSVVIETQFDEVGEE